MNCLCREEQNESKQSPRKSRPALDPAALGHPRVHLTGRMRRVGRETQGCPGDASRTRANRLQVPPRHAVQGLSRFLLLLAARKPKGESKVLPAAGAGRGAGRETAPHSPSPRNCLGSASYFQAWSSHPIAAPGGQEAESGLHP